MTRLNFLNELLGLIVDPIGAQIAGIVLQHDESIATRNLTNFELFKGLRVESCRLPMNQKNCGTRKPVQS